MRSIFALLLGGTLLAGCQTARPVVDRTDARTVARGTLTGSLRGSDGTVAGRTVIAVNTATGERLTTTTNATGGFTFLIPKAEYRLEVELREGEVIVGEPWVVDLGRGDVDSKKEIVLGAR